MAAGRSVRWILRQWTERTPDKPFLIWEPFDRDGRTWTYGELSRDVDAVAFDADGWFDTGDVIRMDEVGNLFFSDRDKDMLRVGSENVAASEIETVIMETGWVTECAVIGQSTSCWMTCPGPPWTKSQRSICAGACLP